MFKADLAMHAKALVVYTHRDRVGSTRAGIMEHVGTEWALNVANDLVMEKAWRVYGRCQLHNAFPDIIAAAGLFV